MKKTLVLGASANPRRYSHMAILRLRAAGHDVLAVGRSQGKVADILISDLLPSEMEDIHSVSMYLRAELQPAYYEQILNINPQRIIFNPGAENFELSKLADSYGIETIEACTLVMLSIDDY